MKRTDNWVLVGKYLVSVKYFWQLVFNVILRSFGAFSAFLRLCVLKRANHGAKQCDLDTRVHWYSIYAYMGYICASGVSITEYRVKLLHPLSNVIWPSNAKIRISALSYTDSSYITVMHKSNCFLSGKWLNRTLSPLNFFFSSAWLFHESYCHGAGVCGPSSSIIIMFHIKSVFL